jgi:peptidoglycan/xylan/chitin deacetylase (PgdA/CDA1 family)
MLKVALTHDVDRTKKTYQYYTYFAKSLARGKISEALYHLKRPAGEDPYWQFYNIAELENSYGLRSTFYILDESIRFNPFKPDTFALAKGRYNMFEPKIQEAIRYLDQNGWEIGLHGSYLSYQDKALLGKEKSRLESILGHSVIGTRQHYLNLNNNTWKIQEELGFEYDSTWGFTKDIGIKDGRIKPFHPNKNKFVVFPLTVMDICFMNIPDRWERFDKLLTQVEKEDSVFVVNFHHRVFNEKEYPGYKAAYIRIIEESLKRNATIAPLQHFYNEYKKANIISA